MNNLYKIFIISLSMILLGLLSGLQAQEIGEVVWEDHFDDPVNDYLLNNIGWMYFGEEDNLIGQEVMQTEDETAWIKSGIFNTVVGASIIQTNGVSFIDPADWDGTEARIKAQNENVPANHDITFQINFKKMSLEGSETILFWETGASSML